MSSLESGLGVQTLLRIKTSTDHPFSFAETPDGLLMLANGIDPMLRWDGLAQSAVTAGVAPPATALELGGVGIGYIVGNLVAFQRFIDGSGNESDLSPLSNVMEAGRDGLIDDVNYSRTTGVVTISCMYHMLTTGETIFIDNVQGLLAVNGKWTITVIDEDSFTLNGLSVIEGVYTQGGYWTLGILTVAYGAVSVPTDSKVVRRQILRNLAGEMETLYVDIDTNDLKSTAFISQATDAALATGIAVPMTDVDDDTPFANLNGVPPSHKLAIASHKGRMFATADAEYSVGHVEVAFNQTLVYGVGTAWKSTFVGRSIYFSRATASYQIAAVDEVNQVITLTANYLQTPVPFQLYTIRPNVGERRLVYYTEAGFPESWPAFNALAVPETNDEIVGMTSLGQYLYVVERRHLHRITTQDDPQEGYIFLSATRGSINNRTYVVADNTIYSFDEIGIHKFDGQDDVPISQVIQNLFQEDGASDLQVDWTADQTLWHAAHEPLWDTIRWFVSMVGYDNLYFAICYNYRTERWWIEQYPCPMTCSTEATFGARHSLCGTTARRIVALSVGAYDGVDGTGSLRGFASSADAVSLTDITASFASVEGAPVTIVQGTGRGQTRIIAGNTSTDLVVIDPWTTIPDATSLYQIGGIEWEWRSGWFRFVDAEEDTARDIEVVFTPTVLSTTMDFQLYYDQSVTPRVWERDITSDGITTASGDPHINVNMQTAVGWARQRLSGHAGTYSYGDTFVAIEMSGVQSGEAVRIAQVVVNGVEV